MTSDFTQILIVRYISIGHLVYHVQYIGIQEQTSVHQEILNCSHECLIPLQTQLLSSISDSFKNTRITCVNLIG